MTNKQVEEYRTVEIYPKPSLREGNPVKDMARMVDEGSRKGYFHRWVEKEFEVDDLFHSGRPQDAGIILKTKVKDCRALIEHEYGTMGYYKPGEFRFTDRK